MQTTGRRTLISGLVGGAAVGVAVAPSRALAATTPPTQQSLAGVVVNVKDPAYGAAGDGSRDDTASIQAALNATPAAGTCYFPPGTYLVTSANPAILTVPKGITIAGAGPALAVIRTGSDASATRVLSLSSTTDVVVRDLGFDGSANTTTLCGVYASTAGTQKNIYLEHCRFNGFMPGNATTIAAAAYFYTSDGIHVLDCEFVGCGRAITIDQPDGVANVIRNRITAASGVMLSGISIRRASGVTTGKVLVAENFVSGADRDPSGTGSEGHAITAYRVRDVQIVDNHCYSSRRGILVSNQCFGAIVRGNHCVGNSDAGIRCEPEITAQSTDVGAGVARGVNILANVCHDNVSVGKVAGANSGIGISMSYAAGSVVSGNLVHDNNGDGIFCDSDRVAILGNIVYNNFKGYTQDPSSGRRGGIRLIVGYGCTVIGNQAFDNQVSVNGDGSTSPAPTQLYGLSMSSTAGHVVHGNNFLGNGTGEIYGTDKIFTSFFGAPLAAQPGAPGTANGNAAQDAVVLNNVIAGLRKLGLFA